MYVFDSFWHLKITQDLTVICLVEWDFFCNLICLVTMSEKALCFSTRFFGLESRDICPTRQIDSKVDVDGRNNLPQMHPGKMGAFSSNQSTFEGPARANTFENVNKAIGHHSPYLLTWWITVSLLISQKSAIWGKSYCNLQK